MRCCRRAIFGLRRLRRRVLFDSLAAELGRNTAATHRIRFEPMQLQFTAVFQKVPEGYIGSVEELPGANTQGATLDEARTNLVEAVQLVLEANRALSEEELRGTDVIREPLRLTA